MVMPQPKLGTFATDRSPSSDAWSPKKQLAAPWVKTCVAGLATWDLVRDDRRRWKTKHECRQEQDFYRCEECRVMDSVRHGQENVTDTIKLTENTFTLCKRQLLTGGTMRGSWRWESWTRPLLWLAQEMLSRSMKAWWVENENTIAGGSWEMSERAVPEEPWADQAAEERAVLEEPWAWQDGGGGARNFGTQIEGPWVFGLICRRTGELRLFYVQRRDSATLLPLIRRHEAPGTTVYSDEWRAQDYFTMGAPTGAWVHRRIQGARGHAPQRPQVACFASQNV